MTSGARKDFRIGLLQLTAGASLISFSPVFVKLADSGPTIAGFYRCLFGGLILLVVVALRRDPLWRGRRPFLLALAAAAIFAADLSLWHRSIEYVGPGLSTIVGNFQVFFLAAFGLFVLREPRDWRFVVAIPMAMSGLVMLIGGNWTALESDYLWGIYLGLAAAAAYASYILILQKSQSRPHALGAAANLAVISLSAAAIMGVEAYLQQESFRIPDVQSWTALLAYGVLCHVMGWLFISRGLTKVQASLAGLVLLLQPTLAFVWDVLFFGRPTGGLDVAGALLALAGIYLGSKRRRR